MGERLKNRLHELDRTLTRRLYSRRVSRSTLVVASLLAALAATGVAAAAAVRSVTAPAPVSAVAFDGSRVAYSVGFSRDDCTRVRIWNLSTRGVSKLGRGTPCVQTSTGTGIAGVALTGSRALWLSYGGGNIREWTLWTATGSKPTPPKRLAFVARDVDAPAPVVVGGGDGDGAQPGDMLPYAIDNRVTVLRANGSRRFTWTAPSRVVAVDAREGRLAVAQADGEVTVLDAGGVVVDEEQVSSAVSAVQVTGNRLLVVDGHELDVFGPGPVRQFTLPPSARLDDASGSTALYSVGGSVVALSIGTGERHTLAPGSAAAIEGGRVAVANGRRVVVLPL